MTLGSRGGSSSRRGCRGQGQVGSSCQRDQGHHNRDGEIGILPDNAVPVTVKDE